MLDFKYKIKKFNYTESFFFKKKKVYLINALNTKKYPFFKLYNIIIICVIN